MRASEEDIVKALTGHALRSPRPWRGCCWPHPSSAHVTIHAHGRGRALRRYLRRWRRLQEARQQPA